MVVNLATLAVALFYLNAIPLQLVVCLKAGRGSGFGIGLSIFEPRFAEKMAVLHMKPFRQKSSRKPRSIQKLLPAALEALKKLDPDKLALNGRFSTGDAAATALLMGSIFSVVYTLAAVTGRDIDLNLNPDFSTSEMYVELSGMISVRVGHIMLAALIGALKYGNGRFSQWISIRSKAS